ncbi:hypothetical protein BDR04DRAFT_1121593 [Suillus decipiens]|nr:hypothetical protein BDR04DRAFT_1121593 [Suillus decipiens]
MRIYTLILINYLLAQMIQSTSHSLYHAATPLYAPVAPSPSVDPEVSHDSVSTQNGCHLSAVADVSHPPPAAAAPPPQHTSAPPLHSFPGTTTRYASEPVSDRYGQYDTTYMYSKDGLIICPWSVGQKHVAEDLEDRDAKRIKMNTGGTNNDLDFKPVLDRYGRYDRSCMYSKDGMMIRPGRHIYHPKTAKHLGCGSVLFKCPLCLETFIQGDACERHWDDGYGKLAAEGAPPSHSATYQCSTSSASPVGVPTTAFTFIVPRTAMTTSNSSSPETMLTEAPEHAPNSESCAAHEIRDTASVAAVLPASPVREITPAEVHRNLEIWRWINEIEDVVDPNLISEPAPSLLPETVLVQATEDPDVWSLINEIEEFGDPKLPLCESPADAAEDPEFCNFPIRTLLICSWLDNSYGSTLYQ